MSCNLAGRYKPGRTKPAAKYRRAACWELISPRGIPHNHGTPRPALICLAFRASNLHLTRAPQPCKRSRNAPRSVEGHDSSASKRKDVRPRALRRLLRLFFFIFRNVDAPSLVGAGANWLPRADNFICIKLARPMQSGSARNVCASCGRLPLDVPLRAAFSCWIPFGDHPLKLERYRED